MKTSEKNGERASLVGSLLLGNRLAPAHRGRSKSTFPFVMVGSALGAGRVPTKAEYSPQTVVKRNQTMTTAGASCFASFHALSGGCVRRCDLLFARC